MQKIALIVSVFPLAALAAFGCNKTSTATASADGGVATADTTGAKTTAGAIVDKALSFLGGSPFEGEITMNMTDEGKPPKTIVYDVKGTKMRFDSPVERGPAAGGYVIFDTSAKKMTSVSDAKKTAMVMDVGALTANADPAIAAAAAAKKPTIDKTGKTDTVAGYSCEIWKLTEENGNKGEVCVAKGISFPAMGRHSAGWMSTLEDGFPLRAVMSDATGKEKTRMEVTKIDKKSLDDAKFEVPAGYQTVNMDDMMKNLGGLRMGGMRPPH